MLRKLVAGTREVPGGPVHIVLGNEACDADSIFSSLAIGLLRQRTRPAGAAPTVPVLACPRSELQFRPESRKLLALCGLPEAELVHLDQLPPDLPARCANGQLELTLTDHNDGSHQQAAGLGPAVVEIIDHHADVEGLPQVAGAARRIAFPLGSCCTLVHEMVTAEAPELLEPALLTALGGVILLDTNNCLNSAKTTERDRAAAQSIFGHEGLPDRDALYEQLQQAKTDPDYWKGLSVYDLLRADYKGYEHNGRRYGIASVNGGVGGLRALLGARGEGELNTAFEQYAEHTGTEAMLAMCCYPSSDGGWEHPCRDLMLYSGCSELGSAIAEFLEGQHELLQLEPEPSSMPTVRIYSQANTRSSRKQVAPLMQTFYSDRAPLNQK